jgi:hypothetical protein
MTPWLKQQLHKTLHVEPPHGVAAINNKQQQHSTVSTNTNMTNHGNNMAAATLAIVTLWYHHGPGSGSEDEPQWAKSAQSPWENERVLFGWVW